MALSVFEDPANPPSLSDLNSALAAAAPLWMELIQGVRAAAPQLTELWQHGGKQSGWSLRLKNGERVLVYLTPQSDGFVAGIVLGERAALEAELARLPQLARAALADAPRYAEGRGIRMRVRRRQDLTAVLALLPFKLATRR